MSQGALCPCHVDSRTGPLALAKPATGRGPPSKAADTLYVMSHASMATFAVFHGHKPVSGCKHQEAGSWGATFPSLPATAFLPFLTSCLSPRPPPPRQRTRCAVQSRPRGQFVGPP